MTSHHESVINYYDRTRWDYKHLWSSNRTLAMHFGYYGHGVRSHRQAAQRMNAELAAQVAITRADRVLDAGCGLGGSSLWLAENLDCRVTGVNITPFQVETARQLAEQRGLDSLVRFELADYAHTPFEAGSYTVFWGLESVVHAESKEDVLAEAYRLLVPGGRVVLAEYVVRSEPPLSERERTALVPWLDGWAMPSLLSDREYAELLHRTGFEQVQFADWTRHVARSLARLRRIVTGAQPFLTPAVKLHIINPQQRGNARASYAQARALHRGLWHYSVLTARRPAI